jgi:hypothetical protein
MSTFLSLYSFFLAFNVSDEISTRPLFNDIYQELSNIFQEVVYETKYGSRASRKQHQHQQQYQYQPIQTQDLILNLEVRSA